MASRTIEETTKDSSPIYRDKLTEPRSYTVSHGPKTGATQGALADITSLLSSKGASAQEKYKVDNAIAARMATDHLTQLTMDINYIEANMPATPDRDEILSFIV